MAVVVLLMVVVMLLIILVLVFFSAAPPVLWRVHCCERHLSVLRVQAFRIQLTGGHGHMRMCLRTGMHVRVLHVYVYTLCVCASIYFCVCMRGVHQHPNARLSCATPDHLPCAAPDHLPCATPDHLPKFHHRVHQATRSVVDISCGHIPLTQRLVEIFPEVASAVGLHATSEGVAHGRRVGGRVGVPGMHVGAGAVGGRGAARGAVAGAGHVADGMAVADLGRR